MPFDSTPVRTTTKARELAALLRDRSRWPAGFVWDYDNSACCAMGLADELWEIPIGENSDEDARFVGNVLGMRDAEAIGIFVGAQFQFHRRTWLHPFSGRYLRMGEVTPEHVATLLDRWADAQEAV